MATWNDVRRIAMKLPETVECGSEGSYQWQVRKKGYVWERPLHKKEIAALGDAVPPGPILAAMVPDVGVVQALLADNPQVYFTTPHFAGFPAILVELEHITRDELEELVVEAWLVRAPKRLAKAYLDDPRTPAK